MTKRPDVLYMADMLDMARQAHAKVNGITLDAFLADEDRKLAVTHLVILIGEAASQVAPGTQGEARRCAVAGGGGDAESGRAWLLLRRI